MQVFIDRKNFDLEAIFCGLPAPVARDFALALREFASFLDMQADDMEARDRRREDNRDYVSWMRQHLPRLMNEALKTCPDLDRAALTVSGNTGVQPVTVVHYWKRYELEKEEAARRERNRQIVALAGERRPQDEIARIMGVSQPTVSRVITAASSPRGLRP